MEKHKGISRVLPSQKANLKMFFIGGRQETVVTA